MRLLRTMAEVALYTGVRFVQSRAALLCVALLAHSTSVPLDPWGVTYYKSILVAFTTFPQQEMLKGRFKMEIFYTFFFPIHLLRQFNILIIAYLVAGSPLTFVGIQGATDLIWVYSMWAFLVFWLESMCISTILGCLCNYKERMRSHGEEITFRILGEAKGHEFLRAEYTLSRGNDIFFAG